MKRWIKGRFKATVHRVMRLQDRPRYSMPLFCNPNFRTIVDPRGLDVADKDALYPPSNPVNSCCSASNQPASCGAPSAKP